MTTCIARDYLRLMDDIGQRLDVPRIEAVHVAPFREDPQKSSKFGAMILNDKTTGITYTGLDNALLDLQDPCKLRDLRGESPVHVAQLYGGDAGWQRSLGMAAINAVSQFVLKKGGCALPAMTGTVPRLELKEGDHVGMVGYFPPLVDQVRAIGTRLTVLELDERWMQDPQDRDEFAVTLDPEHLRDCNKIVCTGTVLVNQTVDSVLQHCREARQILIVGPTIGCLPDPLFDRGVTMLGGNRVVASEKFIKLWSAQEKWRKATKRYALSRESGYPGVEALLSAAGARTER